MGISTLIQIAAVLATLAASTGHLPQIIRAVYNSPASAHQRLVEQSLGSG